MHWKNLTNYNYLGAYSLESEPTQEVTLTIQSIKTDMVTNEGGRQDKCLVATFAEKQVGTVIVKPMILNKTNCKTMQKLFDSGEVEAWVGKQVIVYATTCKMGRNPNTPCLRIKDTLPEVKYHCSICGKEISQKYYDASIKKYGVAICSKECLEEYQKIKEEKGE